MFNGERFFTRGVGLQRSRGNFGGELFLFSSDVREVYRGDYKRGENYQERDCLGNGGFCKQDTWGTKLG